MAHSSSKLIKDTYHYPVHQTGMFTPRGYRHVPPWFVDHSCMLNKCKPLNSQGCRFTFVCNYALFSCAGLVQTSGSSCVGVFFWTCHPVPLLRPKAAANHWWGELQCRSQRLEITAYSWPAISVNGNDKLSFPKIKSRANSYNNSWLPVWTPIVISYDTYQYLSRNFPVKWYNIMPYRLDFQLVLLTHMLQVIYQNTFSPVVTRN